MSFFFKKKKFPDSLDTAVFTTVHVMKENSLITLISHEIDGDWQFMGVELFEDYRKIAMVVGLGEIIKRQKCFKSSRLGKRISGHKTKQT